MDDEIEIDDLIGSVTERELLSQDLGEREGLAEQEIKSKETERKGRESYFKLRSDWSSYLFWMIWFTLSFQFVLSFGIGIGFFDFLNYEKVIYVIIGENFAQIVGMGYIVVRYLFPQSKDN